MPELQATDAAPESARPFDIPAVPYHVLLDESAARSPEKVAVRSDDESLTYAELVECTHRMARVLEGLGVQRGDRVAIAFFDQPEYVVTFHAASRLGAIAVPINPSLRAQEALHIVRDAEARVVVGVDPVADQLRRSVEHVVHRRALYALLGRASPAPVPPVDLDPDEDLVLLQYSSGTTGRPRGVMMSHRNLVASHLQYVRAGRVRADDVSLVFVPFAHTYGTMLMGGALAAGATQVLMERFQLERSLGLVERHGVTLYYCTTAVLVELLDSPLTSRFDLSTLRYINCGGAPLPADLAQRARERLGVPIANGYGLSEAPIVGHLVPGEERRVVSEDDAAHVCGPYEHGELQVRGPHVMKGYWKDPEATARALRDGWLRTGDIGFHDEHGHLHVTARAKELIKYKGFAVSPTELEGQLMQHPAVADCAVAGRAGADGNELPTAFVVVRPGGSAAEAVAWVNNRVSEYKRLRGWYEVSRIPRNATGKVVRRDLWETDHVRESPMG